MQQICVLVSTLEKNLHIFPFEKTFNFVQFLLNNVIYYAPQS